jgi:2-oxoisovalerate dehydrogenase E2 component (dihydrolipoyl transacylase)
MVDHLLKRFVKEGDKVEEFSKICEVQSDKAAVEISSRYTGTITKLYHEAGAIAKVGFPLVDIDTEEDDDEIPPTNTVEKKLDSPKNVKHNEISHPSNKAFATPAVRRIAKENKINIDLVTGTGPKGRVLKGDVLEYIQGGLNKFYQDSAEKPAQSTKNEHTVIPLSPIQKAMFKSMTKSLAIPHFGFADEIMVNSTSKLRNDINAHLKSAPKGQYPIEKISFMPIFLKAISEALKKFPILNAKIIDADSSPSLQYRNYHNIGIAMDTPQGYSFSNSVYSCRM